MIWDCLLISSSKGELLLCAELCMFTKYLTMASALSWSVQCAVFVCGTVSGVCFLSSEFIGLPECVVCFFYLFQSVLPGNVSGMGYSFLY